VKRTCLFATRMVAESAATFQLGFVEAARVSRLWVGAIPLKGWHTLRHSYTTLLRQNGNDPKVVQDLLRHASYQITANIYDSAVSDEKREAHSGVIRLVTRASTRACEKSSETATA
jgi:integrase